MAAEPGENIQEQLRYLVAKERELQSGLQDSIHRSWLDQAIVGILGTAEVAFCIHLAIEGNWWTAGGVAIAALYPWWFVLIRMPKYRRSFREMLASGEKRLVWAVEMLDKVILREMENGWDA